MVLVKKMGNVGSGVGRGVLGLAALLGGGWAMAQSATPAATLPNGKSPLAIVPIEAANRDQAKVSGALQVTNGTAFILTSGTVTSGAATTNVVLPRRGVLRVCAGSTVSLAADSSVPEDQSPGLMMAMDHGAIEASFAIGRNSDIVVTPDFRIVIGGPGASELKVRLGEHGDTCVDNAGANAPYVLVSSVFDGGAYRVQAGQRVMFQHGNLHEVVDQEKEPCGCPAPRKPDSNEFPMDESAGLTLKKPDVVGPPVITEHGGAPQVSAPLVYAPPAQTENAAGASAAQVAPQASAVQTAAPEPPKKEKKPGFFRRAGRFFKKIFGAD